MQFNTRQRQSCKTNLKAFVGILRDGIKTFLLLFIKNNHRLQNSHAIKHNFERRSLESYKDARKRTLIIIFYLTIETIGKLRSINIRL